MRKYRYFVAGVFILGLVFSAGNSFSQLNARGGVLYSRPEPKCLASVMISSELKTAQGIYVGEINDLVIDPGTGRVSGVVLARIQGMGPEVLVTPFSAVTKNSEITYGREDFYQFVGEAPHRSMGHPKQVPMAGLTAGKLIGALVRTAKGEDLGRIDDLVIDHMGGNVISFIFVGKAGRPVTVPFSSLSESGKGAFTLKSS